MGEHRRVILHSDMNCFYANVECQARPKLRDKPVVVGGSEESRHGIVLAKNQEAKRWGIQTAEALWQARKKCPDVVVIPPNYQLYLKVSRLARRIYLDYTDLVEPFGPDEAWLDVTGSLNLWGGRMDAARLIAAEISERVKSELGVTVSIGISWNKIFAKFGSDYRKPDAITEIDEGNWRTAVWNAPVRDLLYVGPATERKMHSSALFTIGDIAHASDELMRRRLGKVGLVLKTFARGEDITPVRPFDENANDVDRIVKSYGNGLTAPHDIDCEGDAKALIWLLAESVAQRLREGRVRARTIEVAVRSAEDLSGCSRQVTVSLPTDITGEIASTAWKLLRSFAPLDEGHPLRALHVRATNLVPRDEEPQMTLFDPLPNRAQAERLDGAVDELRRRFGNTCLVRGVEMTDESLAGLDIKADNIVHPESFFH